jgi:UDP-glucose 4-epimerase
VGEPNRNSVLGKDKTTAQGTFVPDYIDVNEHLAEHHDALKHLRAGGENLVTNCGYGRGYSVLEVIETVKRVSHKDFPVEMSPRRLGDPAAIVARADKIRAKLGWQPKLDDLSKIVTHALAWETKLKNRAR